MRFIGFGCVAVLGMVFGGAGGCANSGQPTPGISVLPKADSSAERLVAYLETRHVQLTKVSGEETRIEPGPSSREGLIRYLGVCQLRLNVCTENVANINTSHDSDGKLVPYRRQIVEVGADGEARVCRDDSPFRKEYSPGHPDAGADGMVYYPNVDMSTEMVECGQVARDYKMALEILRRIDPSVVISEADVTDAFEESD